MPIEPLALMAWGVVILALAAAAALVGRLAAGLFLRATRGRR